MTSTSPDQTPLAIALRAAQEHVRQGRADLAERAYQDILQSWPRQVEALNFIAMRLLRGGQQERALGMLREALAAQPDNPQTHHLFGLALAQTDQYVAAAEALGHALEFAPKFAVAHLHLGQVQEHLGQDFEALTSYARALNIAQPQGYWLGEASTPPGLRELVRHAIDTACEGRRRLFDGALQPLRAQYGSEALKRVEQVLAIQTGEAQPQYADPRQKPQFLLFPGLPAQPFFDCKLFPWLEAMEARHGEIRDELLSVLEAGAGFQPFLELSEGANEADYLGSPDGKPTWDAFFFYRHGVRFERNFQRCARTAAAIETLPLVRIREHGPEICFSILTPGTHILPHRGVTNTRLVAHLPLVVPEGCALRVGGVEHHWREGQCVVFDDTFEHEAWNRGPSTRAVLIFDIWNPYLSEPERAAVTELVGAIGDFNRACWG